MIAALIGAIIGSILVLMVITGLQRQRYVREVRRRNYEVIMEAQARLTHRALDGSNFLAIDPVSGEQRSTATTTGCAHATRAVSVVPFAHNAPEAWICPDCSEVVDEPVPLGPYRRDVPPSWYDDRIDATRAPTAIQRRTNWVPGTPPPRIIPTGTGRIDATAITADRIHATPVMSTPEAQRAAEARIAAANAAWDAQAIRRSEALPLGPGWRRERDGSITQLETPTPTRLTARDYAVVEGKVVDEVEFEEVRSWDGSVRIRVASHEPMRFWGMP